VNQLDDDARKEDPVINEFPDVFPDDLPGICYLTETLNFLLNYYLERTHS
jgi:hypothetical protein